MMIRTLSCLARRFHRFAAADANPSASAASTTVGVPDVPPGPPERRETRPPRETRYLHALLPPPPRGLIAQIGEILAVVALAWVAVAPPAAAQSAGPDIEGRYEVLQPPQLTETGDRIEVVDVFWYGCPHCYTFLPMLEAYELVKPEYVEIRRLPAIFRESWVPHARAFYTAELLGVVDATHRPLFEEIHEQRNPTDQRETLAAFFERRGVDRTAFEQTYDSFAVESLVRKSILMQQRYGITGTPSVVVNGKYRVTGRLAGGYDNVVPVIMALVEKEREAQQGTAN